ncbi:hypothetical protein [Actinomadura opuntiae]|uniref:hypothetical protein n=1 Tax=Actinomadura sp. OS1-43 TaxID=604315 RepID=UPI00255B10E0|nr:hypothetical protein [Actinomadura sp. OS1-43]MDL4813198.1 hypothetical protein [Actinomadura sp. OS1-43]
MVDHETTTTDERTELLAGELHEHARTLNHLVQGPPGLTRPEAVRTIVGNLAQTMFRLVKVAEELDVFLDKALDAGRLRHDRGDDPLPSVLKAHDALVKATEQSMDLGESFVRARRALADIHGTKDDTESQQRAASKEQTPTDECAETASTEIQSAAEGFPHRIGDVLPGSRTEPAAPEHRPHPKPPPPRREM